MTESTKTANNTRDDNSRRDQEKDKRTEVREDKAQDRRDKREASSKLEDIHRSMKSAW